MLSNAFRTTWGAVAAAVVAGPLSVWAGGLDPPDPPGLAVMLATPFCAISLLLSMIWATQLSASVNRWIATLALIAALGILTAYMMKYFETVINETKIVSKSEHVVVRVITGSTLRDDIQANGRNKRDLLLDYGFDPRRIWTEASLRSNQVRLHILFTLGFALMTAGFGLTAAREARAKQSPGKTDTP